MNIATLLEMSAEGFGDRTAYGRRGEGMSFRHLLGSAQAAAHRFRAESVSHVALIDENSPAVPVALFGAALAGVPYAPINYRLAEEAISALLDRLGRTALVAGTGHAHLSAGGGVVISPEELVATPADPGDPIVAPGEADDVAIRLFTSGTTGVPKAAVLRHRNLSSYVLGTVEFGGAGEDEATLVSVPPYHVAGVASVLSAVYSGRRVVQLPNFTAENWISAVVNEQITHAMVVPTMLTRIVDLLTRQDLALPSLRHLSYGGGRMPVPVIEQAMRLLPDVSFVNAYGLTETSSTVALLGPADHREAFAAADGRIRRRLGSVGRPIGGIEIEIRDSDGKSVGPEVSGEVWVRGEQVAGEYSGAGPRVDHDGWFPTNDGGYLDSAGYVFLEGRLDDVIVRGGENMSPGEIEDVLLQHDAITDAAVIGAPDAEWGEKVVAFVISNRSTVHAADVRDWVKSRLRSSRTPHDVHFVDELPYSDTGKLLRRELRRGLSEPGSST
ncbi:AMP-dependent synthetase [Mycolicibacterium peregrinum]|uniref:class I adenylate-forming enzyme family protein n=1 Tax=Mycolicibacterium peregrinum TaxID=43304 RepID=UPI0007EB85EC|nr:AMP-binding protein [Mycolicibacterium peregrinum]OBF41932.1 AMP-dependent synthetase [Mycolicibacterium peregrinum]